MMTNMSEIIHNRNNKKYVLAGYRSWAIEAFHQVIDLFPEINFKIVNTQSELSAIENSIILGAGWSSIINEETINGNEIIALMHPSDLPNFAGGTPIQHQILMGVENTKATLFEVDLKIDSGPIIYKTPMSLKGNMNEIFSSLTESTTKLFSKFIDNYPEIPRHTQEKSKPRKRLKPADSKLSRVDFENKSAKELYNFIRCREDPYPNAFISDESGTLYIKSVSFRESTPDDDIQSC